MKTTDIIDVIRRLSATGESTITGMDAHPQWSAVVKPLIKKQKK